MTILPNHSYCVNTAKLRYIQSVFDQNPDHLVGEFLPLWIRLGSWIEVALKGSGLRSSVGYRYMLERTLWYDRVFIDAASAKQRIVIVGSGTDTRAYRYAQWLQNEVIECDLEDVIIAKQKRVAQIHLASPIVAYAAIDLNDVKTWTPLLSQLIDVPALVMMEGVAPYIVPENFRLFLMTIANLIASGSRVAYDYKIPGAKRALSSDVLRQHAQSSHQIMGYELLEFELSRDLDGAAQWDEDALLVLKRV